MLCNHASSTEDTGASSLIENSHILQMFYFLVASDCTCISRIHYCLMDSLPFHGFTSVARFHFFDELNPYFTDSILLSRTRAFLGGSAPFSQILSLLEESFLLYEITTFSCLFSRVHSQAVISDGNCTRMIFDFECLSLQATNSEDNSCYGTQWIRGLFVITSRHRDTLQRNSIGGCRLKASVS